MSIKLSKVARTSHMMLIMPHKYWAVFSEITTEALKKHPIPHLLVENHR